MKKAATIVGIAVLAVLVSLSVVLIVQAATAGPTKVELSQDGAATEDFRITNFLPGDSREKEYSVNCPRQDGSLSVAFSAGEEDGLLPYVNVKLTAGETVLFDGALENLIGEAKSCGVSGETLVTITYSMPLDVGNEAQGAGLDVHIVFEWSNEKQENAA